MKTFYPFLATILFSFCLPAISLFGQTYTPATLNVSGGSNTINNQVFEYSVGEMALVHTATAPNIIVTQGVLQPSEIETGISDSQLADGQILVYPNPVDDIVNVAANLPSGGTLQLRVYDLNGKMLNQKEMAIHSGKESTSLRFAHLASGSYVLKAVFETGSKHFYRDFKIQKLN